MVRFVDQVQAAGRYEITRNALNAQGARVSTGVYLYNLGFAFQDAGRDVEAGLIYNQIFTMHARAPIVAKACNQLGLIALTQNDLNTARQMFQRAVRVVPRSAVSHSNLALVKFQQGNITEAKKHIEDALMYQPDFAEVYYQRGVVQERLDQKDNAI